MQIAGADAIENVGGTALSDQPTGCAILDRWLLAAAEPSPREHIQPAAGVCGGPHP
jgi:hypothetical protein